VSDRYRKKPETISQLNARQFAVTQESATEPAFQNEFWDHKEAGIYVDIVSAAGGRVSPCRSSPPTWPRSRIWPMG
jgi:peptide methionine sulfoxide reductase MsrB